MDIRKGDASSLMQMLNDIQTKVQDFASENASTLLTAGGVVGTVATAVLAGRAGFKAANIISAENLDRSIKAGDDPDVEPVSGKEKFLMTAPHFIPPVITGGATVTAIIFANRMSAQKAAALAAAYGLSQKQFEEYREKVAEKLTGPKNQAIKDELAQERANRTPGASQIVIVEGGDVLCFDQPTGRYFKSTMEKINRAVNRTNEEIIHCDHATANFFYEQLGLPTTTWGDAVGWTSNHLVELDISTILSPEDDSTPCLAIDFKRLPSEGALSKEY
jgi:hypothetical protein